MAKKSIGKFKVTYFTIKFWLLQIKSNVQKLERLPRRIINRNTGRQYWHIGACRVKDFHFETIGRYLETYFFLLYYLLKATVVMFMFMIAKKDRNIFGEINEN